MDVQGHYGAFVVEMKHRRAPSARKLADLSFDYPLFRDKPFDDQRYGASLQAGDARQLRAGYRLLFPNEVEDKIAVDLPRCPVRRALRLRKSESLYQSSACRVLYYEGFIILTSLSPCLQSMTIMDRPFEDPFRINLRMGPQVTDFAALAIPHRFQLCADRLQVAHRIRRGYRCPVHRSAPYLA